MFEDLMRDIKAYNEAMDVITWRKLKKDSFQMEILDGGQEFYSWCMKFIFDKNIHLSRKADNKMYNVIKYTFNRFLDHYKITSIDDDELLCFISSYAIFHGQTFLFDTSNSDIYVVVLSDALQQACSKNKQIYKELMHTAERNFALQHKNLLPLSKMVKAIFESRISRKSPNMNYDFREKDLEDIVIKNIQHIESGMTFLDRQVRLEHGVIDIIARDKDEKLCIIEVKCVENAKDAVYQATYYPTLFDEETRFIIIAPNYSKPLLRSLTSLGYVELYTYTFKRDICFERVN